MKESFLIPGITGITCISTMSAGSSSSTTIRNVQYQHLVEMLNFNLPESPTRPVWKLFVMDAAGQKILGPSIKVNDLREHGVTLFLQLKSQRERVPDVPAVYFVEPCPESVASICQDLQANMYDSYYLNFTSQISRDLLEELAQAAHQTGSHTKIAKVYDQYLNYITLEDNLFTLEIPKVTRLLFSSPELPSPSAVIDSTASGIFSVLMSFGCCAPIICSPSLSSSENSLAKGVCSKLESRIKNHLINTKSPLSLSNPSASPNQPRPLLLVVDRRIDLAGPLKHSSAYNALIDEILGLNSNQIQIAATGKTFDIDKRDWFWRENSTKVFPKVAEAVESALKTYKTEYDRVLQTTPGMTEDLMKNAAVTTADPAIPAATSSSAMTPEQLKIAINVLPELTERKKLIDTHLQISTALLDSIKTRDLGTLFSLEEDIVTGAAASSSAVSSSPSSTTVLTSSEEILSTLKNPKIGNAQDKLRLLLIYLIYNFRSVSSTKLNVNFIQEALDTLKPAGDDLKTFQNVLTILTNNSQSQTSAFLAENVSKANSAAASKATSPVEQQPRQQQPITLTSSITSDFFNRLSSTTNVLVSSVKSLMPNGGNSESPLTKIVDSAYAQVTGNKLQGSVVTCIDPRPNRNSQAAAAAYSSVSVSVDHIILFVIGGAAYSEYDHLLEHFNRNKSLQNLKFTFGVTEVLNPKKFLHQLSEIQK